VSVCSIIYAETETETETETESPSPPNIHLLTLPALPFFFLAPSALPLLLLLLLLPCCSASMRAIMASARSRAAFCSLPSR
jgi:hypothetical protein